MKRLKSIALQKGQTKSYDVACRTISENVDNAFSIKETRRSFYLGYRHLATLWCFFYFAMLDSHITVVSVAIVVMVNHTAVTGGIQTNTSAGSCSTAENALEEHKIDGPFSWDSETQGQILGLTFLGYIVSNSFAGKIAEVLGAKRVLLFSDFFVNVCTIVSPFAASWNVYALLAFQTARNFFQGFIVPCTFILMANWFRRSERGLLSSFVACGTSFGSLVTTIVVGALCDLPALGWRSAFYTLGGFNLIGTLMFACVFHEVPKNHPHISKEELEYITEDQENDMSLKRPPTPWREMFTSVPVYALAIGKFGYYWSLTHFLCMHPTFMGTVLHFSMNQNGFFTSMIFLFTLVGSILSMTSTHCLGKRNCCSVNTLRKSCSSISALGFSICMVGVVLSGCDATLNLAFCGLTALFGGFGVSGTLITSGDMSPTFSGSLTGFTSSTACLALIFMPLLTGALTQHEALEEWHLIFYTNIAVVLVCALIFQLFGSADVQPWDSIQSPEAKTSEEQQSQIASTKNTDSPTTIYM